MHTRQAGCCGSAVHEKQREAARRSSRMDADSFRVRSTINVTASGSMGRRSYLWKNGWTERRWCVEAEKWIK